MMKRLTTVALTVAMLGAAPGVAVAQDSTTSDRIEATQAEREADRVEREAQWIEEVKARAIQAIEQRLRTIDELETAINSSQSVDPGHAQQLLGELRASASGLEVLAGAIRAASDLETLRTLVPQIFEVYRIYAVIAPKVHLVLAAGAAGVVAGRLDGASETLSDVLERLEENDIDVSKAQELLVEMQRLVASGSDAAASVPGMVLNLTPADYPGSTETLRSAHSVLKSARTDLRAAGETAHEIVRFIKSVVEVGTD